MVLIRIKEDSENTEYDYSVKSIDELTILLHNIYKPILSPSYKISLSLSALADIKFILNNQQRYDHIELYLILTEGTFRYISLAMPGVVKSVNKTSYDYFIDGIAKRHLIIRKNDLNILYHSIIHSYEEIDYILDLLYNKFGSFTEISKNDMSKYIVLNDIVYPRQVLIAYINLYRFRSSMLYRCLNCMNENIVMASMVKALKQFHTKKCEYLKTGLCSNFIKTLNTRNLNYLYYLFIVKKPYHFNDVTVLLSLYERGITFT